MDTTNQNDIDKYINSLPQEIQAVVSDGVWEQRTGEIAKKYALNPDQTEALSNNVLLVLVGIEKPETFLETTISDLNISNLLAEQIIEDLESRVFEYAMSFVEDKRKKIEVSKMANSMMEPKKPAEPMVEKTKIPEIRPENLPAKTSSTEKSANLSVPRYIPNYKPTSTVLNDPSLHEDLPKSAPELSRINYAGTGASSAPRPPEPVQKPVSVPRFTAVPIEEEQAGETPRVKVVENAAPVTPQGIMDNKLNNVTRSGGQESKPAAQVPKYAVDPYREPLS